MTSFITRIELHDATEKDYERLHAAMEAKGFSISIPMNDGKRRKLPTAMYYADSSASDATVIKQAAVEAADTTGRKHWVISFRTDLWSSNNLPLA